MTERRMAYIDIYGIAKKVDNEKIKMAIQFYAVKLLGKRLANNVFVEVNLTNGLRRKSGAYGFCVAEEPGPRPRFFSIELDADMGPKPTFEALAHEMVHVKQFCRGELQDRVVASRSKTFWNGKEYDTKAIDYWELPWEIEAHGRERGLYLYLMDHFKQLQIQ